MADQEQTFRAWLARQRGAFRPQEASTQQNRKTMELQAGQYMGEVPFTTSVGGIVLATSQHLPRTSIPAHHHVNPHFTYVLEGSYEEAYSGQRRRCQVGDLLFHPPQWEHGNAFQHQPVACFNVEIGLDCLPLGAALRSTTSYQAVASPQLKGLLRSIIQEVRQPDCFSEAIAFGYAVQLAGGFLRSQRPVLPASRAIHRVQAFLDDTPQHTPTLLELAQVAGAGKKG